MKERTNEYKAIPQGGEKALCFDFLLHFSLSLSLSLPQKPAYSCQN